MQEMYNLLQFKSMFNNRPSSDMPNNAKKLSASRKPDSFSIGWDVAETNTQRKKDKEPDIKLGAVTNFGVQSNNANRRDNQQEPTFQHYQPSMQQQGLQKQKSLGYTQEEVFQYMRRYQKLEDMPQQQLDKVLLYYEDMKNSNKQHAPMERAYEPNQQDNTNKTLEQSLPQSSNYMIQKREPIRPRDNLGGTLSGGNQGPESQKGPRSSNRSNQSTLSLGDGLNHFTRDAPRETKKTEFQRIQDNSKKPPSQQGYKISNIFG